MRLSDVDIQYIVHTIVVLEHHLIDPKLSKCMKICQQRSYISERENTAQEVFEYQIV